MNTQHDGTNLDSRTLQGGRQGRGGGGWQGRAASAWLAGLLLAGISGLGCASRAHMTPGYGKSARAAALAQTANPKAGQTARPLPGFDAQEADIVARSYRQSLAPKGQVDDDKGMVILAPSRGGSQPNLPPPSVPERR